MDAERRCLAFPCASDVQQVPMQVQQPVVKVPASPFGQVLARLRPGGPVVNDDCGCRLRPGDQEGLKTPVRDELTGGLSRARPA